MARRKQLGDLYELPLSSGFAYLQYVFDDASLTPGRNHYGSLVRILSYRSPVAVASIADIELAGDDFCCFCAIGSAHFRGLVRYLGTAPVPDKFRERPAFKQHYTMDKRDKKDIVWFVAARASNVVTKVGKLTPEQRSLPLLEFVGIEVLKERLESGWQPEDECEM